MSENVRARDQMRLRVLLMGLREALLIALGCLEDYLGLERTKPPRRR